jgi:type IV pilus biogenesis protein CpaD/CtpE
MKAGAPIEVQLVEIMTKIMKAGALIEVQITTKIMKAGAPIEVQLVNITTKNTKAGAPIEVQLVEITTKNTKAGAPIEVQLVEITTKNMKAGAPIEVQLVEITTKNTKAGAPIEVQITTKNMKAGALVEVDTDREVQVMIDQRAIMALHRDQENEAPQNKAEVVTHFPEAEVLLERKRKWSASGHHVLKLMVPLLFLIHALPCFMNHKVTFSMIPKTNCITEIRKGPTSVMMKRRIHLL